MLEVVDDDGASSLATCEIEVLESSEPNPDPADPTARFSFEVAGAADSLSVNFDAIDSEAAGGAIVAYEWDFGDGSEGTGGQTTHTYAASGDYIVKLTVYDSHGGTGEATQIVSVGEEANVAPIASLTASPSEGVSPLAVDFDASASSDSDGSIASYEWDFGDGDSGQGSSPLASHTYDSAGSYTVLLTVTDNDGATGTASLAVVVTEVAPEGQPLAGHWEGTITFEKAVAVCVGVTVDLVLDLVELQDGSVLGTGERIACSDLTTWKPATVGSGSRHGTDVELDYYEHGGSISWTLTGQLVDGSMSGSLVGITATGYEKIRGTWEATLRP